MNKEKKINDDDMIDSIGAMAKSSCGCGDKSIDFTINHRAIEHDLKMELERARIELKYINEIRALEMQISELKLENLRLKNAKEKYIYPWNPYTWIYDPNTGTYKSPTCTFTSNAVGSANNNELKAISFDFKVNIIPSGEKITNKEFFQRHYLGDWSIKNFK
jgi:hypothetical protein